MAVLGGFLRLSMEKRKVNLSKFFDLYNMSKLVFPSYFRQNGKLLGGILIFSIHIVSSSKISDSCTEKEKMVVNYKTAWSQLLIEKAN